MKKILFLILILFISISVYSLDCQYTTNNPYQEEVMNLYSIENNEKLVFKELEYKNILKNQIAYGTNLSFEVYNNNDFPVKFEVSYKTIYDGDIGINKQIYDVEARDYVTVQSGRCGRCKMWKFSYDANSFEFSILDNNFYEVKYETETFDNITCLQCQEKDCLNDGQKCGDNLECGGGFCVEGICNNKNEFYNGINPCSENEVACNNNQCIQKGSVKLGFKPVCSEQECVSGRIKDSVCFKSIIDEKAEQQALLESQQKAKEDKLEKEKFDLFISNLLLIIISLLIGGGLIYAYFKFFREKEETRRTRFLAEKEAKIKEKENEQKLKELDLKKREYELKENEMLEKEKTKREETRFLAEKEKTKQLEKQIEIIKEKTSFIEEAKKELKELIKIANSKKLAINEQNRLINQINKKRYELKIEQEELEREQAKNSKLLEERTTPYQSPYFSGEIWRNPEKKYYPCLVNSGELAHRYIARTKIYPKYKEFYKKQYPKKDFSQLQVHHIDGDYQNHGKDNLVIISKEEHNKITHGKIFDRESGIKELQKNKINAPNIIELDTRKNSLFDLSKKYKLNEFGERF